MEPSAKWGVHIFAYLLYWYAIHIQLFDKNYIFSSSDLPRVLEAPLLLLLQLLQEFIDGLLHLVLIRSGIHVFFMVLVGAN